MTASLDFELGPAAVGTVVGLAGLLFLLEPVALSAVVLAAGLSLGAVVFYRRGRRLFALAHGVFGVTWAGVVVGTALGSGTLLSASILVLLAGCAFLVTQGRADRKAR